MWYFRRLADGLTVVHTRPEHAFELEALQRVCFSTLDDAERFKAAHYRKHLELFADGQFVVQMIQARAQQFEFAQVV